MSVLDERLAAPHRKRVVKNPVPWYTPRFWHGMRFSTWIGTLAHNHFDVSFTKSHTAASITLVSGLNSFLALLDRLVYSRKVEEVEIPHSPLFILGHWRAGTTFLHELLICDPEHTYPNTYQCFVPHHFVLTETWLAPLTSKLIPSRRPMDNMAAGWRRPQEDEFALSNLGVPTPYLSMLFPRRGEAYPEYLDLRALEPAQRQLWGTALHEFFKRVTFRDSRRIIVKSPPHTARVRTLLELYPDAKFVHIVRDPYDLFVSTMGLWKSLNEVQRIQVLGDQEWVEEYVLGSLERMYAAYEEDRQRLAENQIVELRYEDLVQDPHTCVRKLYAELELGEFASVEPALNEHLAAVKNYHPNHYEIADEKRAMVRERWAGYFEKYGY
ncbi:sulfotransferase family protein [Bythopirellula polymerisocia]|uniref:Sulfotransferase domain protein n=1 Tax=Bythopirellula polymerisocia TaxID=2528003 RepID=A0A5C6CWB1_9BACT|nr:sulfotransferase [Bythopirellula polymerisocia]TWU27817.1 Sulfotransferase domain protein [Bythopirellula polymerisocia]